MTTFIDTSVLFAGAHTADKDHEAGRRIIAGLRPGDGFTSDHVLLECWFLLARHQSRDSAMRFWQGVRFTPLRIEYVEAADMERALSIAEQWADQDFSLVDCTSFAVMERVGCRRAASFDSDFAIYRYGPDRTRAFEILH